MPIEDLHAYAELVQRGDSTAAERLQLLENHRQRIQSEMQELTTALELVERKIAGYDQLIARTDLEPPDHRPAPRTVHVRPAN